MAEAGKNESPLASHRLDARSNGESKSWVTGFGTPQWDGSKAKGCLQRAQVSVTQSLERYDLSSDFGGKGEGGGNSFDFR